MTLLTSCWSDEDEGLLNRTTWESSVINDDSIKVKVYFSSNDDCEITYISSSNNSETPYTSLCWYTFIDSNLVIQEANSPYRKVTCLYSDTLISLPSFETGEIISILTKK